MKKVFNIFLCWLIIITGCSSTHHLANTSSLVLKANDDFVTIELTNGETIYGKIINWKFK